MAPRRIQPATTGPAEAVRNRAHWAALLPVITAHVQGHPIEMRIGNHWVEAFCPTFQPSAIYRIKP